MTWAAVSYGVLLRNEHASSSARTGSCQTVGPLEAIGKDKLFNRSMAHTSLQAISEILGSKKRQTMGRIY